MALVILFVILAGFVVLVLAARTVHPDESHGANARAQVVLHALAVIASIVPGVLLLILPSYSSGRTLLEVNEALGLPPVLGSLGGWYDGATFALEAGTPALMYGPSSIDRAHTVGEWVPIADLVACAQGLALAAWRLCR